MGIIIKKACIVDKLVELNFFRFDINPESYRYIKITDNQVEEVSDEHIIDGFFDFIEKLESMAHHFEDRKGSPIVITSETIRFELMEGLDKYFSKKLINRSRPDIDIDIQEDDKENKYLFFRNGYVLIDRKGYKLLPYKNLKKFIWKNKILDRDFVEDTETGDFERFFYHICGHTGQGDPDPDVQKRILSLKTITGYLLHGHFERKLKAVILTDSRISDNKEPNGRTGKTLYSKSLGRILNNKIESSVFVEINGKNFDTSEKFRFETCNLETQLISINDIRPRTNITEYTSDITEGIAVNKKNEKPFPIRAKVIISTNLTIKIEGYSNTDRIIQFEFADYYDDKRSPEKEFGHWFFSKDWNAEQWNRFDTFLIGCCQEYFRHDLVEAEPINLFLRTLLDHTPSEFVDFMDDWIAHGKVVCPDEADGQRLLGSLEFKSDEKINKKEIYEAFTHAYPNDFNARNFKQRKLTEWLRMYCKYNNGYEPISKSLNTEGRSGGIDWIVFKKH